MAFLFGVSRNRVIFNFMFVQIQINFFLINRLKPKTRRWFHVSCVSFSIPTIQFGKCIEPQYWALSIIDYNFWLCNSLTLDKSPILIQQFSKFSIILRNSDSSYENKTIHRIKCRATKKNRIDYEIVLFFESLARLQ